MKIKNYVLKLLSIFFESILIIFEKFSSMVFLLCLCVVVVFCIDFTYAIIRTMIIFHKTNTLKISPLIVDQLIYSTTIATYGAKSISKRFSKKDEKNVKNIKKQ